MAEAEAGEVEEVNPMRELVSCLTGGKFTETKHHENLVFFEFDVGGVQYRVTCQNPKNVLGTRNWTVSAHGVRGYGEQPLWCGHGVQLAVDALLKMLRGVTRAARLVEGRKVGLLCELR